MKKLVLLISLVGLVVASQSALADHRRGYRDFQFGSRYRSYNSYHYSPYRNRGYIGFAYGGYPRYRYRNHRYDAGSFVGGLVLGSLLSPGYSHRHYDSVTYTRPVTRTRRVIVRQAPATAASSAATGRRLLRDLEGNCYERITDEDGNEVRIQLEATACAF